MEHVTFETNRKQIEVCCRTFYKKVQPTNFTIFWNIRRLILAYSSIVQFIHEVCQIRCSLCTIFIRWNQSNNFIIMQMYSKTVPIIITTQRKAVLSIRCKQFLVSLKMFLFWSFAVNMGTKYDRRRQFCFIIFVLPKTSNKTLFYAYFIYFKS